MLLITRGIMQYTTHEKNMLEKVNEIGMQIGTLPEENFIFVVLSPYLDRFIAFFQANFNTQLIWHFSGLMR